MFVACPHCGYLVALIVAKDGPARACPRCGGSLQSEAADARAMPEATAEAMPDADADTAAEADTAPPAATTSATATARIETAPTAAPVRDEISQTLRRAPAAPRQDPPVQTTQAAAHDAEPENHNATATGDSTTTGAAPDADPNDAGDDDVGHDAGHDSSSDSSSDSASADGTGRDAAAAATEAGDPPALHPLSAPAAAAGADARTRRQRKSETTVTSARRAPSFARQQARAQAPKPRLHWGGPVAIAALSLALALQLLLAQRAELAADAHWRPLVAGVCRALGCSVPPWHEPAALTMLNRNVLPVPERAGVLRVTAGFRNDARWSQPWPVLVLSLEDVDGRRVGHRAFAPQEYRRGYRPGELIAPGQSAAVQFEVIEPAPRVVAFTFDFR